ncbi:hypothetical protein JXA02_04275 [candidate division KSB1 bacterium]|nr:hypothetical protein [candidate division KSB1 bacterium]RQW08943.1 MAG: hypothetical protein EH222_04815 [candidate division KSB1 bacterium]
MKSFLCKLLPLALLLSLIALTGCKKVTIKTVIRSNGSLQRTISVDGDSLGVDETVYPFPQDGSWDMMSHKDSSGYTYIIRKDFRNAAELNEEFDLGQDTIGLSVRVRLDKKFRWFYSFYRYEECFVKFFPFTGANLADYVTEEEIKIYNSGEDSIGIDERIEEYAAHALIGDFYNAFVRAVEKYPLGFDANQLEQKKRELFAVVMEWDFIGEDDDFALFFLKACDQVYRPAQSFAFLVPHLDELNRKYREYIAFSSAIIGEGYHVIVQLPGRVLDTNANNSVKDHEVVWEFEAENIHFHDYVLWVESRRLNVVPTLSTGLVVLAGLLVMWFSARRAHRQKLQERGIAWQDRRRWVLKWWMSVTLIVIGLALAIWFISLYIVFASNPVFLFLDYLHASPRDKTFFIAMIVTGGLLACLGAYHLALYIRRKKKGLHQKSQPIS